MLRSTFDPRAPLLPCKSWRIWLTVWCLLATTHNAWAADWKFSIRIAPEVRAEPFSGRVYLFFNAHPRSDPREGPDWFHPQPFVSLDVENWKPAEPLTISPATEHLLSFPEPLANLDLSRSRVQAVVRLNPHERDVGTGPGNGFSSKIARIEVLPDPGIELVVDRVVPEHTFQNSDHCQELVVPSTLLSQFHGRAVSLRGAVSLPESYKTAAQQRYPVIIEIPGFGGTHYNSAFRRGVREDNEQGVEFIRVMLDPSCARGHHVFADSANNGPVGQALLKEFLPQLDAKFRTVAAPTARFLTGHSSGGWSSLWLQTTYPEAFGGTWSTSPDSVDFSDFQGVNLYQANANLFRDEAGHRRPLGHEGPHILLWADGFSDMEHALGYGGQLQSFEAVFSPRGEDGRPLQLWDRRTGSVDQAVAAAWKPYDIRLRLQTDWPTIGPRLAGKLHVFMGSEDTFYLQGATQKLKATLTKLGSDAAIEILPGRTHFNLFAGGLEHRIRHEMVTAFLKYHQP